METYNVQLMCLANYTSEKSLKHLYRQLNSLIGLSDCGDSVAASITIDLQSALHSEYLTDLQKTCIQGHLIEKSTLKELAEDLGKSTSTVSQAVTGGIKNVRKALNGGKLYEARRTGRNDCSVSSGE